MAAEFQDAHIVVTGGTGALGRAVVAALVDGGATCHIPNLNASELKGYPFADHPQVKIHTSIDLTDEAAVVAFYAGLPPLWGSTHIAGGFAYGPIAETSAAEFEKQYRMNALTAFLCSREAAKRIRVRPAGGRVGGRIVNVSARPALKPRLGANMVAYTASKAAIAALTQALAEEVAGERIWVNAIAPSIIDTPTNRATMPDADPSRWVKTEDIAVAVRNLLSPANGAVRGSIVQVYGGS
jgi:NAD(P)-dependent dehydrogenase (short-subunit alcohol dehydrogenase family)